MEHSNMAGDKKREEKLTMADRFITAMFVPKEYKRLLKEPTGKVVQFLLLIVLLVTVITYVIPTLGVVAGKGGVKNIILNEVPDFSLKDGTFTYDSVFEQEDEASGIYILIDTDVAEFKESDIPQAFVQAIMVSQSNMLISNNVMGMQKVVQEYRFSDFKDFQINNKLLASQSYLFYIGFGGLFLCLYVFEILKYMVISLFYTITMLFFVRILMLDNAFGDIYKTSLYAQSIGAIVCAIAYCVGSQLLLLTGTTFAMLITFSIIRRVCLDQKMQSML